MTDNKTQLTHRLTSALIISASLSGLPAWADELPLSLPEQPLANAVASIARQGKLQILYDASAMANLRAPALHGQYSAQTALQKLLIGSGLELIPQGEGYIIHAQAVSANSLMIPETNVTGIIKYHPINDTVSAPQFIGSEEIRQRSTGEGNVTELLKSNPSVQFSNNDSTSMNQGEIKPSRISIHGASSYQNAYKLDGVSFNNDIDPSSAGNGEILTRIDSDEQGMYVDSRLIDSVTVYDNNIPVEYGGFTGGTVDVTSRRWQGENRAHLFYRQTKSGWNKIFLDPDLDFDTSKNDTSNPARFQNRYDKKNFGGWFEAGITDNTGIVFSASRRTSDIPMFTTGGGGIIINGEDQLEHIEQAPGNRNQQRTSDNFFLKYSWNISEKSSLDLSANYSDYSSHLFSSSVLNSGYDNDHKGINFTASFKHQFRFAELDLTASYQHLQDKRTSDQKDYIELMDFTGGWNNPLYLKNGGQGDLKTEQESKMAKGVLRFNPVDVFGIRHSATAGFEINNTEGHYKRDEDYYRYRFTGYAQNEQEWSGNLMNVTRFRAGTHSANYTSYALFIDNNMEYGRLTVRPGVRLDRDDFVGKNNLAPRLTSQYDLFGTGDTLLIAGANRYYGRSMLTYALYGAQNAGMQNCNFGCDTNPNKNDWEDARDFEGLDSLSTPYNDELSFAIQQQILSTTWRLQYVHREGYDEVRSRTKYPESRRGSDQSKIRTFDNGGRSSHDTVTLSMQNTQPWEWAQASHVLTSSVSWQQSKSNTPKDQGYAFFDPATKLNSDKVWYDGKVIDASKLPSTNFNSPLKFNLELTSVWDEYNTTWFNRLQWHGPRNQAVRYDNDYYFDAEYGQVRKYDKQRFSSRFTWDTKLTWQPEFAYGVGISVEVNNVLNTRNVSDKFINDNKVFKSYEPGRQFWLQLTYDL